MRAFLLLVFFFFSPHCLAHLVDQCGHYVIEGRLKEFDRTAQLAHLISDKGSDSEFNFFLKTKKAEYSEYVGTNIKVTVDIEAPCSFFCEGTIVSIDKLLDPFRRPKTFLYPAPRPIKQLDCQ